MLQERSILPGAHEWASLTPHPRTVAWNRAGDVRVLLAAGYALLLQVSHPTVGAGVSEHSQFRRDPWGRLFRTLDYACTMVYAGPGPAAETGARLRSFHRHIRGRLADGTRYDALEPEAYAWVHATLAEGIVAAHTVFGRPFTQAQCEELWAQWRAVGRLLGVREQDLPAGWPAFRHYFDEMVERRLAHTAAVDEVLDAMHRPASPRTGPFGSALWAIARPALAHSLTVATVGLMPSPLRERLGVSWSRANTLELLVAGRLLRAMTPLMPGWLLNTGPGYLRWREQAIARGDVAAPARAPE